MWAILSLLVSLSLTPCPFGWLSITLPQSTFSICRCSLLLQIEIVHRCHDHTPFYVLYDFYDCVGFALQAETRIWNIWIGCATTVIDITGEYCIERACTFPRQQHGSTNAILAFKQWQIQQNTNCHSWHQLNLMPIAKVQIVAWNMQCMSEQQKLNENEEENAYLHFHRTKELSHICRFRWDAPGTFSHVMVNCHQWPCIPLIECDRWAEEIFSSGCPPSAHCLYNTFDHLLALTSSSAITPQTSLSRISLDSFNGIYAK